MSVYRTLARTMLFAAAILTARPGFGAPALTVIQDILYKADGTRFTGSLYITWTNFQSSDSTIIPVQALTVPVINGAFKVQLVPTTIASPGANYNVVYSSQGRYQFTETWAVPPSTVPLKVRDVRVTTGSQVGPPPVLTQLVISDVTGLAAELTVRPSRGVGWQPARAAVINSSGQLDAAGGNLGDCIRVDGTSAPCGIGGGGGGSNFTYVDNETPTGPVDGVNFGFSLQSAPSPASSLTLYRNGLYMSSGVDYTLTGTTITFYSGAIPQPGDVVVASYRVVAAAGGLTNYSTPQVICSATGNSTSAATPIILGRCTIPAGILHPGDRIDVTYDYTHQGTQSAFVTTVSWGGSTIAALSGAASDAVVAGRSSLSIGDSGTLWSSQVWNGNGAITASAGNAPDPLTTALTIRLYGRLAAASSDTLVLRNFTVVRQPAQSNP